METTFLPRAAAPLLERLLQVFPAVAVMEARQVGKSTLVRHTPGLARYPYLSLDDLDHRLQAQADPQAFLRRGERLISSTPRGYWGLTWASSTSPPIRTGKSTRVST